MSLTYVSLHAAIVIDSTNDVLKLDEAGVVYVVTLTHGTWYVRGDGSTFDFCAMLATQLGAAHGSNSYAVTMTTDGVHSSFDLDPNNAGAKVRIAILVGATAFRVKWLDAGVTFIPVLLGFVNVKGAANTAAELSSQGPTSVWVPNDLYRQRRKPKAWEIAEELTADGDTDVVKRSSISAIMILQFKNIHTQRIHREAGSIGCPLETFLDTNNDGRPMELHERDIVSGTIIDFVSDDTLINEAAITLGTYRFGKAMASFEAAEIEPGMPLFDFDMTLVGCKS